MEYITSKEAAKNWGVSDRRIRVLCSEGRIDGATKVGSVWNIPARATYPSESSSQKNINIVVAGPMGAGVELSNYLLESGQNVCVIASNQATVDLIKQRVGSELASKCLFYYGNLSEQELLDKVYTGLKDYNISKIFFNETFAVFTPAENNSTEVINDILGRNLKGTILTVAKLYPLMQGTQLVFLIPRRAATEGIANQTLWSAVWSGVVGFSKSVKAACKTGENIEVVNIYHGAINSDFWKKDAMSMPVDVPSNLIDAAEFSKVVVDTLAQKSTVRVSEIHVERLNLWKK